MINDTITVNDFTGMSEYERNKLSVERPALYTKLAMAEEKAFTEGFHADDKYHQPPAAQK